MAKTSSGRSKGKSGRAQRRPISVEDLWRIERIASPSLSPDGAQAVAAVTRFSMDENKAMSSLWLMSTLGGAPRPLTRAGEKDGSPRWSPHRSDGRDLIAFTARREQQGHKDDESQLYLISPDGGEAWRATDLATGVDAFRWCPGGRRLILVSWVWPELKGMKAQAAAMKAFRERKETGYVTSQAHYRHWDRNLPMGRVPHLLLLELDDERKPGRLRDLFEDSGHELGRADPDVNRFDVSPDGKRVVFAFDPSAVKMPDGRMALAEMELKSARVTAIAQDREWNFTAPRYSPDGNRIAFLASHQGRKHTMPDQLAVWERDGAWDVASGEWDHEVQAPLLWEDDGLSLLLRAEQKGRTHLWRFDLQDRRAEIVVTGGCVTAFDKCAGTLVTVTDSALHPGRLHAHPPGEAPLRIESFNDELFDGIELSAVEEVWFEGAGSIRSSADEAAAAGDDDARDPVQMWLAFPPGFDASDRKTRHPVMHVIHGGPHTAAGDTWHYRWNMQVFAAQGYVVASVNYHGSSSFGHAFLDSITHRWGELELQDIEAATDWLMHKHWVDKRRIVATGGSYGGFMVAWMNGHVPPGRYQAYVCHAGCFDWVGMFADDTYTWHPRELGARYWNDMDKVLSQSPHAHVAGMRTPTLVIHGALDFRVPDAQGLAYYNTLKALNVPARLLWFPDENHWVLKPRNSRLWHEEFFAWLKLYSSAPIK